MRRKRREIDGCTTKSGPRLTRLFFPSLRQRLCLIVSRVKNRDDWWARDKVWEHKLLLFPGDGANEKLGRTTTLRGSLHLVETFGRRQISLGDKLSTLFTFFFSSSTAPPLKEKIRNTNTPLWTVGYPANSGTGTRWPFSARLKSGKSCRMPKERTQ